MTVNALCAAVAALLIPTLARAEVPKVPPAPVLEHVGIYVADTRKTARIFTEVLGLRLNSVWWAVQPDAAGQGGLKLSFIDGNGMQFTLIEPTSPGPAADELARLGDGALAELDYEVPDFEAEYDFHQANGIRFVTMGGAPFPEGQKGWTVEPYGLRLVYLPPSVTHGIVTELYQRGPAATDILNARDRGWAALPPVPADAPRLLRTLVLVADLDRSAAFLARVLRLPLIGRTQLEGGPGCARFDAGSGSEIELIQPPATGPLAERLQRMGDGYLAGLLFGVRDLDAAKAAIHARGAAVLDPGRAQAEALTTGCHVRLPDAEWFGIDPKDSAGLRLAFVARP